jgi:hypothetical protein
MVTGHRFECDDGGNYSNSTNELMTKHEMITRKFIDLSRPWTLERTSDVGKGRKKGVSALTWELPESNTASQF